jgi:uncharacterized protein YndB with AHSA1/START domain
MKPPRLAIWLLERPRRLVFSWQSAATHFVASRVTIELRELDDGTELLLRHETLPDSESRARHAGGWETILDKLAVWVSSAAS